ncbi:MAG: Bacterial rane protein YfhO, partial [Myxococcales bacterium]|nr:Bacterial rane protein YfhO [Myxococcales bacterium]
LAGARAWSPLLIAAATLVPFAFAAAGRLSPRALPLALVGIVVADLLAQSVRLTDWVPSSLYRETPPPVAAVRALAGPGLIRLYRPQYLAFADVDAAPAVVARATLRPNVGVEDGLAPLDAYDNFEMVHEAALWAALTARPLRMLEVTATRFALVPPSLFAGREGFVQRAAWPALHAVLAEATHAAPRVYLAIAARVADDASAAQLLQAPDFVPGRAVVLAPADGARDLRSDGSCTLERDRIEELLLRCHASSPSYAVVADAWFPGWRATVDGAAAPILRANLAMRAVPVPAGDPVVELRYRPRGLVAGAVVSLLALLAALALALTGRAYRPPSPAAPGSPPSPPDRNTARSPASPNPQTPRTPAAPG